MSDQAALKSLEKSDEEKKEEKGSKAQRSRRHEMPRYQPPANRNSDRPNKSTREDNLAEFDDSSTKKTFSSPRSYKSERPK